MAAQPLQREGSARAWISDYLKANERVMSPSQIKALATIKRAPESEKMTVGQLAAAMHLTIQMPHLKPIRQIGPLLAEYILSVLDGQPTSVPPDVAARPIFSAQRNIEDALTIARMNGTADVAAVLVAAQDAIEAAVHLMVDAGAAAPGDADR